MIHRAYSPLVDPVGHPHWRCDIEDNRFAFHWQPPELGRYALVGVTICSHDGVRPDMLGPEGVRCFIDMSYEPYTARFGGELGGFIAGAFTDEPGPGGFLYPWARRLPEEFHADHGYESIEQLPHLCPDLGERSPAVRHYFRLTQHRLQLEHYVGQLTRW